jgi:hypothetical protein
MHALWITNRIFRPRHVKDVILNVKFAQTNLNLLTKFAGSASKGFIYSQISAWFNAHKGSFQTLGLKLNVKKLFVV